MRLYYLPYEPWYDTEMLYDLRKSSDPIFPQTTGARPSPSSRGHVLLIVPPISNIVYAALPYYIMQGVYSNRPPCSHHRCRNSGELQLPNQHHVLGRGGPVDPITLARSLT